MTIEFVGYATGTGTSSTITVDINGTLTGGIGSSPQQGDLILAYIHRVYTTLLSMSVSGNNSGTYTTQVIAFRSNDTWDSNSYVASQVVGTTPDTSITFSSQYTNTNYGGTAIVLVFRGVDTTTPMDVTPTTATGINTNKSDAPSITPVTSGSWILSLNGGAQSSDSTAFTTPSGMTAIVSITGDGSSSDATAIASRYSWTSGAYDPAVVGGGDNNTSSSWTAVTVALRPAATGGTTYNQSIGGSLTVIGLLTKQTQARESGTLTPSATLITTSVLSMDTSGSITPQGILNKSARVTLLGTLLIAGAVSKRVNRIVSGSLSAVGSVFKRIAKTTSGSVTPSASLAVTSIITKAITGAITLVGTLATLFIAYVPPTISDAVNNMNFLRRFIGRR